MYNYCNIYKFGLPFLEAQYEETLFQSIISDLKESFLYFEDVHTIDYRENESEKEYIFLFSQGKIHVLFQTHNQYFVPKIAIQVFFKHQPQPRVIKNIVTILESIGIADFIFEYDYTEKKYFHIYGVKDIYFLEKNFNDSSLRQVEYFLQHKQADYIQEELRQNMILYYRFIYMIYICFDFYRNKNSILTQQQELTSLHTNIPEYQQLLILSKTRLDTLHTSTLAAFTKYKQMLDVFWKLFE